MKRFLVGVLALIAWAGACDDGAESHVYVAAPYDASADCFGASTSLAQIDTPNGDLDCAPTCLVVAETNGSNAIYVSTMCGPYPSAYNTSQTDPGCAPALAAWPAEQAALANGSSSCASPAEEDGGGGADASAGDGGDGTLSSDDGASLDETSDGGATIDAAESGGDASND